MSINLIYIGQCFKFSRLVLGIAVLAVCVPAIQIQAAGAPDETVSWTIMNPITSPDPRFTQGLVYDSMQSRFIMHGGFADLEALNETWSYDPGSNLWTNLFPDPHPWAFRGSAFAYDSHAQRSLLFGTGALYYAPGVNETWAYDSALNAWTNLSSSNAPSARFLCSMVYDVQSDKMILFGGVRYEGAYAFVYNQTYSFDYDTNNWTDMSPVYSPAARYSHSLVYDTLSDRVILFGGFWEHPMKLQPDIWFNDTWTYDYDSNTWTNVTPTAGPSARMSAAATYDPLADRMVMFGGRNPTDLFDDTWAYDYDGNQWIEQTSLAIPEARNGAGMAYAETAGEIVMFGGIGIGYVVLGDTWSYQGTEVIPEFTEVIVPVLATMSVVVVGLRLAKERDHGSC